MVLNGKKEPFLRNNNNKEMFIIMLSKNLEQAGCHIHNVMGGADLLITQTVIAVAKTSTSATILVGDDKDLLILLCHHVPSGMTNVYFRPEPRHMYFPTAIDKDPAPAELLEIVRCNCKTGFATKQCSCRKKNMVSSVL